VSVRWWVAPALLALGCAHSTDERRREAARGDLALCNADVLAAEQAIVNPAAVESVEPCYSRVGQGRGSEARLCGATVTLRVSPSFTREWLERVLLCHRARRVTEAVPAGAIPNDPFWLPDGWVDFAIDVERGRVHAHLYGDDVAQANQIFARAKAFQRSAP